MNRGRAEPLPGRRRLLAALALSPALAALGTAAARAAEPFPQRQVRIVVPFAVGIGPDVVARSVAERLQQQWGVSVVVDNKPGASGIVAFSEVRRTPPDGHTLFLADSATLAVNPLLHAALPYDPQRDLAPLSLLFRATFVLWTGAGNRLRSMAELLEAARRGPDTVSFASLGNGHTSHVTVEAFAAAAGIRLLHVPFKDAGALFTAIGKGDVDFTAFSLNTMAGLLAAGRVRPLAVAAAKRLPGLPDTPTVREAGGPPTEMQVWAALVGVAGTPAPVLEQLQRDIAGALGSADVRARAEAAGFEITPSTPQQLRDRIDADIALYKPLVAQGRIARV